MSIEFAGLPANFVHRLASAAASDNATNVLDHACTLKGVQGQNAKASTVYLKLYDKATAPVVGDTPKKVFPIPASAVFAFDLADGVDFVNGLGYRITGGAADSDATALVAADVLQMNLDIVR